MFLHGRTPLEQIAFLNVKNLQGDYRLTQIIEEMRNAPHEDEIQNLLKEMRMIILLFEAREEIIKTYLMKMPDPSEK